MSKRLQYKLYNYEVNPPQAVWDKIAASLDESHLSETFPSRLYNIEATPPAGNWEKIEFSLQQDTDSVAPVKRKYHIGIRYLAAAIFIGLIAFTVIRIINNPSQEEQTSKTNDAIFPNQDSIRSNPAENLAVTDDMPDKLQEERDDAALEASKKTFAKLEISPQKRMMALNPEFLTMPVEVHRTTNNLSPEEIYRDLYYGSINSDIHLEADKYNISDRYTMLMTPEGHVIRMAKKWGDLLCCVAGEEQDEECKDQLKKWRTKIASAPIAPSPGNFLDILNLISSLKENHP